MANKKIECPLCEGDGLDWDQGWDGNTDCRLCEGEGEVDGEKMGEEN